MGTKKLLLVSDGRVLVQIGFVRRDEGGISQNMAWTLAIF